MVRARDEEGRDLDGGEYDIDGSVTQEGRPFVEILKPGKSAEVVVSRNGYVSARLNVDPDSDRPMLHDLTAVLRKAPDNSIRIRVLRPDGSPTTRGKARVDMLDRENVVQRSEQVTLEWGRGVLRWIPAGWSRIQVRTGNRHAVAVRDVSIQPGHENAADFRLPPTGDVRVTWNALDNHRELALQHSDGTVLGIRFAETSRDGVWITTSTVPLGRYRLVVRDARGEQASGYFDVVSENCTDFEWVD